MSTELSSQITLHIDNVHTTIQGSFPQRDIDKKLSYMVPGAFMSPLYRLCPVKACKQNIDRFTGKCRACNTPRAWDGKKHFLLGGKNKPFYFPTGCLSEVIGVLKAKGYIYRLQDHRKKPVKVDPSIARTTTLIDPDDSNYLRIPHEHQYLAVEAALRSTRGLIVAPTRSGKSSIIAMIAKIIHLPTAIFINNVTIGRQLQAEIGALTGTSVGFIGNGEFEPRLFTICMIQTMNNELSLGDKQKKEKIPPNPLMVEYVNSIEVMLHDEVHHIGDNSWYGLTKEFTNAFYRFGLSGTMNMRSDGDDLLTQAATGKVIYEIDEQTLIDKGIIARPIVHFYTIDSPVDIEDADYKTAYQKGVVENVQINDMVSQLCKNLSKNYKILVLLERQEHILNLEKSFEFVGFDNYKILTGKDIKQSYRKEIIDEFTYGDLSVLVATKILDEGVTMPAIDLVIRLGAMKTAIKTKQQIGRGQGAKKDGKANVMHVVDFAFQTNKHLSGHSMDRFDVYHKLGYEIHFEKEIMMRL